MPHTRLGIAVLCGQSQVSWLQAVCKQAQLCMHSHTCTHVYTCTYTRARTHTRAHTHAHARTHARTHTHKLKHSLPWAGLLGMLWYNGSQTTLEMNRIQSFTHSPFCSRNETGHNPSAIQSLRQPPKFNPPLPQLLVQSFSNACTPLTDWHYWSKRKPATNPQNITRQHLHV